MAAMIRLWEDKSISMRLKGSDEIGKSMTVKELLLQEIDDIADPLLVEVLDYLRYLKFRHAEDVADIREARVALAEAKKEGTIPWEEVKAQAGL